MNKLLFRLIQHLIAKKKFKQLDKMRDKLSVEQRLMIGYFSDVNRFSKRKDIQL